MCVDANKNTNTTFFFFFWSKTQTSVIASLLAAGYTLGNEAIQAAKEFDGTERVNETRRLLILCPFTEKNMITSTIKIQAESLKAKVCKVIERNNNICCYWILITTCISQHIWTGKSTRFRVSYFWDCLCMGQVSIFLFRGSWHTTRNLAKSQCPQTERSTSFAFGMFLSI
jgi:hypothetical protein